MVLSYWDMAASLVTTGAIDPDAFHAAHREIFATFSKIYPYLAELRAAADQAVSSLNAVKTGLCGRALLLADEEEAEAGPVPFDPNGFEFTTLLCSSQQEPHTEPMPERN